MSIHAHRTEGVTGFEEQEGVNAVGGGIGVGDGNGDRNGFVDANGDVNSDGDGDGARKRAGVETNKRTLNENRYRSGDVGGTGTGTETKAVAETVTETGTALASC